MTVTINQAAAAASTMYAQAGSDASNGCTSPATPCATVSHALTDGGAGCTINVSGTIADCFTINYPVAVVGATPPGG